MRQPPSDRQRRSPFNTLASPALAVEWRHLGWLMLGVGLGAIGMKWIFPQPNVSTRQPVGAVEVEASSDPSAVSERNRRGETVQRATANDKVADATVCVKTYGPRGEEACASGVSIDPQLVGLDSEQGSVVLTNFHVIADPIAGLPVQLGGQGEVYRSQLIKQSPEFDLALLFVPDTQFPQAALAEASPEPGTTARAIGFPNNQPLTIRDSTLIGRTQNCLAVAPCLAIEQGTITHGNSGGPLEANEQVIGIVQGETTDEIAIPIEQVQQFLADEIPDNMPSAERFASPDRLPPQFEPNFPPMREPHYHVPPPTGEPYPPYNWL